MTESDDRFRAMADATPVLMWTSGPDKSHTFFNKGWLDFTGRALEQELGDGVVAGHSPRRTATAVLEPTPTRSTHGKSSTMEYRLRRHDGRYRWIFDRGVARFCPEGASAGYIGSAYDVTELKEAEERPRQILEATPYGMIMTTREGAITLVNKAATEMFGYAQ